MMHSTPFLGKNKGILKSIFLSDHVPEYLSVFQMVDYEAFS